MEIINHQYSSISPFEVRHTATVKAEEPVDTNDEQAVKALVFKTATAVGKSPYAYDMLKPEAKPMNDGTIRVTWDRFASSGD
jgi:hypothetical protein